MAVYVSQGKFTEIHEALVANVNGAITKTMQEFGFQAEAKVTIPNIGPALMDLMFEQYDLWAFPHINSQQDVDRAAANDELEPGAFVS